MILPKHENDTRYVHAILFRDKEKTEMGNLSKVSDPLLSAEQRKLICS
jgi:hypothetical protein